MTLRPLQNWYEKMLPRERFTLLLIAWAVVGLWFLLLTGQVKRLNSDLNLHKAQLKSQQASLDKKTAVENKLKDYAQIFKTSVSSTELMTKVQSYVQATGMPPPAINSSPPVANKESIFTLNTVTVRFNKTDFRQLVDFTSRILAEHPYLMIKDMNMSAELLNPTLMDGDMNIQSLELKPGALEITPQTPKP